jgi:hypothetical protein
MTFKYNFNRYPFFKFLGSLILFFGLLGSSSAQTIPVGMPFFDDALRRAQLMGQVDENVSFMIRPVHPRPPFLINTVFPLQALTGCLTFNSWPDNPDQRMIRALPAELQ